MADRSSGQDEEKPNGGKETESREGTTRISMEDSKEDRPDVLGYKVTFPANSSFVKFTPLTSKQDLRKELEAAGLKKNSQQETKEEDNEEVYKVISEPEGGTTRSDSVYAVVVTPKDLEEEMTPSMTKFRDLVIEGIVGMVNHIAREGSDDDEEDRRRSSRNRRNASRRRRRNNRGSRGSRRRASGGRSVQQNSEPSMYEVVEVDYQTISRLKPPNHMDWRIVPRYELSPAEVARQEKELYYLLTSEEGPEEAGPGEPVCCVCSENLASRVVVPCGHRCLCHPCALQIAKVRSALSGVKLPKRCPICQAAIGHMMRIR